MSSSREDPLHVCSWKAWAYGLAMGGHPYALAIALREFATVLKSDPPPNLICRPLLQRGPHACLQLGGVGIYIDHERGAYAVPMGL